MISLNREAFGVFGKIRAEEDLKQKTASYLHREMEKRAKKKRTRALRVAICCVSFALLFLCGGVFLRTYFTPVAYIDFDVNPSVELRVNRFGRVIASHAYNDDGKELLEEIHVSYLTYDEAAKRLLGAMGAEGYFRQDALLCVTVQTNEQEREGGMLERLKEIVAQGGAGQGYDIFADIYAVTEEVKHCASEHQVSPAKYLAIEELIEVDPEADFETCRGHSVHEIRQMIRQRCGGGEHEEGHSGEEHSGEGHNGEEHGGEGHGASHGRQERDSHRH